MSAINADPVSWSAHNGCKSMPVPPPCRASSAASTSAALLNNFSASCAARFCNADSFQFRCVEAFAAIFVPSIAITPNCPIPACTHSTSTWVNKFFNAARCCCRNRATTVWSGTSRPQATMYPTSVEHARSIPREDNCPFMYA